MLKTVLIRSNPVNPDPRLEKEATSLARHGFNVIILCWDRSNTLKKIESMGEYVINRISLKAPVGPTIAFFLPLWWIYELIWLLRNDWDVVHVVDFDCCIPGLIASKIRKKPIIYDLFDYYPEMINLPKIFHDWFVRFDKFLMRYVDSIILVDDCKFEQICFEDISKVTVIYNAPEDYYSTYTKSNIDSPIINIFYGGVIAPDRDIKSMIDVVADVGGSILKIAGYGYPNLIKDITDMCAKSDYAEFVGKISYSDILSDTADADILYALYDPRIRNNKYASPTKLFDSMMFGKPIITNEGVATADIVRNENCGLVVPYGDYNALKAAVITLKNNPELRHSLGNNGRSAYVEKYCWAIMEKKLISVYLSLLHTH